VDTTAANAEIKVRLRIRDIGFGIDTNTSPCSFNFTPPSLLTGLWLSFEPFLTSRITGDEFDGTYETSLVVPKGSEPGLWLPSDLWCHDRAGNRGAPLCVGEACAPGFTVVNQGEFAPLDLVDFRLRQTEVDTSLAAASLEVEVTVRDSLDSQGPVNFRFVSPSGRQYASSTPTPPFVSGMYRVEFPERAEPGDWVVEHLWTASGSSRYLRLTAAQLAARGFDTVVQVRTAPILHAANSTGVLLLWWETDQTGFVVETTSVLAPAVWEPVPGVVTRVSGAWVTAVTGGGAGQYFRLRQGP
jgi:hypothetical protein